MTPSAQDLHYFLEVAKQGNVSRAATSLSVSQPTLSMAIKRLEDSLGTELFVRFKTGVHLTPPGRRLVQEARGLLEQWERIRTLTLGEESTLAGHFRVGAHVSVALYALPQILPLLRTRMPELEVSWVHDLSRNVAQKVLDNELDMALVINPVEHPDLVILPLARDKVTFWKHPKLENFETLIYDPDLHQSQDLLRRYDKNQGRGFRRRMTSPSLEVVRTLVTERMGVGILPERVAARATQKLERLSKSPVYEDILCLIYRAHQKRGRAFNELKEVIKEAGI